jgi:hypothetical protein
MKNNKNRTIINLTLQGIIISTLILSFGCKTSVSDKSVKTVSSEQKELPFVNPPLKKADIPYSSYNVKASKETVLTHTSGSRIHIPANAFVDEEGNPVKGNVTIQYREMRNARDFFVSGIPMTFEKDSTTYHFESAGMFDIRGKIKNKPVFIASDKSIRVEMTSNNSANRFNSYYLDTVSKKWIELGKNKVVVSKKKSKDSCSLGSEIRVMENPIIPLAPRNADSVKKILIVRIQNRKDFPEFDAFQNLKFEVVEDHGQYRAGEEPMQCANPTIIPLETKPGFYQLNMTVLKKGKSYLINWVVRPAFEGNDYTKAMAIYQDQLQKYKQALKRQAEEQRQQELERKTESKREEMMADVYRVIQVKQFGIFNCDNPLLITWPQIKRPVFFTMNNKKVNIHQIIVIDKSINGIVRYDLRWNKTIQINPKSSQMVWGMANDTVMYSLQTDKLTDANLADNNCKISVRPYPNFRNVEKEINDFTK